MERVGYEDSTHWLVVREMPADPNDIVVPGKFATLVDKRTGAIEYVVPHLPEVARRIDAMRVVRDEIVRCRGSPSRRTPAPPPGSRRAWLHPADLHAFHADQRDENQHQPFTPEHFELKDDC